MGSIRVTVTVDGVDQVIAQLNRIGEQSQQNLVKLTKQLAGDGKDAWRQGTPRRTGRLQSEETAEASGLSITYSSPTYYYKFVDEGHMTPRGWRTKHGFRLAHHRSHVAGREMTPKLVEWLTQNTTGYLSHFLDGVE